MFVGIIALMMVFIVKQFLPKNPHPEVNYDKPFNMHLAMNCVDVTISSYGFTQNLFSIASKMKKDTVPNICFSVGMGLGFCFSFYLILTLLAINLYGERLEINLFSHMDGENDFLSVGVRFMFCIIFFCKIPFIFFPGKLFLLNAIFEF